MNSRRYFVLLLSALCLAVTIVSGLRADPTARPVTAPREVTLTGKVVDLQCFMTGKFPSADRLRSTRDCLRAGVPAALETADGLVILGQGVRGPQRTIVKLAMKHAEVRGMLYERHGVRYIDIIAARETASSNVAGNWDGMDDSHDAEDSNESDDSDDSDDADDLDNFDGYES